MDTLGIEEWLRELYTCSQVVTNSFHAIAFSIIFHKPFIAVLINGSGMNDRIITLLESVDLLDFVVIDYNEGELINKLKQKIDWGRVDKAIESLRGRASKLLLETILEQDNVNEH